MAVMLPVSPVVAKARLKKGDYLPLITVPKDKTNATVDITAFYDVPDDPPEIKAKYNIYLSTFEESSLPLEKNMLFKGVELDSSMIYPEIGKILIGAGQTLAIELVEGVAVNFRISGLTEVNQFINRAGRLHSTQVDNVKLTEVYRFDNPLGAYVSGTLSFFNHDKKKSSNTRIYVVQDADAPLDYDLIMHVDVPEQASAFIENILLRPLERILVISDVPGMTYMLNGVEVSAVYGGICENDGELEPEEPPVPTP